MKRHDGEAWAAVLESLLPAVHEVDRAATRIWFHFYPVDLVRAFRRVEDPEDLARSLEIKGDFGLESRIDSSHRFLYGHRYWPEVKAAIVERARSEAGEAESLEEEILQVARQAAGRLGADGSLVVGIAAVGFMTLQQVGLEALAAAPGEVHLAPEIAKRSPGEILRYRARDDRQGLAGLFRGQWKRFSVTFDEADPEARFKVISSQELTTGSMSDPRPHDVSRLDPRCTPGEGPIPVECRSAACGTCWVGVLAGTEKLSPVESLERRRIRKFGYIDTDEPHPPIRLACQARAFGNVHIVVPPWNGIVGKFLQTGKPPGLDPAEFEADSAEAATRRT